MQLRSIQYAAVMGINADLHLTGNDFSNASTAFFIAYLIAEVPNGESHLVIFRRIIFLYLDRLSSPESPGWQMVRF